MDPGSRPGSASAFDVEDGYRKKLKESDPHRLEQRQKAIDKGKNTRAYANYIKVIPKHIRPWGTSEDEKKFPRTPDKYEIASKRGWEGKVRAWRLRLHQYNPEPKEGEEVIKVPTAIPRDQRLGLTKDSPTQSKKRERDGDDSQNTSKRISHGPGGVLNFDEVKPLVEKPVNVAPKELPVAPHSAPAVQAQSTQKKASIFDDWSDGEVDDIGL